MSKDQLPSFPESGVSEAGSVFYDGDRYQIQKIVASGSEGMTYLLYDKKMEQDRIAKMAPLSELPLNTRREAQMLAQLRHPNIVMVYDFLEKGGYGIIIEEYCPGGTLHDRIFFHNQNGTTATFAVRVTKELAAACAYLAQKNIFHRDIKPANIFFDADDAALLGDFGLAEKRDTLSFNGTDAYLPPETVIFGIYTEASDVFCLALIFVEMLSGEPVFPQGTVDVIPAKHLHHAPRHFSSFRDLRSSSFSNLRTNIGSQEIMTKIEKVVVKALEVDRLARYQSVDEFIAALELALDTPSK